MKISKVLITSLLLVSFSSSFSQSVTKGLIGYWPFNGNANDESVNNNHGKVTGAQLTVDRFGNKNSAYIFDGNGDYIDCGDSANLFVSTNTTNFWFLYTDSTKAQVFVNDANSNSGEWGANYYHHATAGLVATLGGGSNNSYIASVTRRNYRYADSMWHMFTSSYDAKTNALRFYLDGCFVGNINQQNKGFINGKDSLRHNGSDHWMFGTRSQYFTNSNSNPDFLSGCLDDVMLFNRVLSPLEIAELYSNKSYTDTTHVTVYDTSYITINDTTFHYDTVYVSVTDTLFIKSYLNTSTTNPCVIKMFPNPTNDEVTITNSSACSMLGYTLTIIDDLGKLIYKSTISGKSLSVNLKQFAANGLYHVSLTDSKGKIVSQKKLVLY